MSRNPREADKGKGVLDEGDNPKGSGSKVAKPEGPSNNIPTWPSLDEDSGRDRPIRNVPIERASISADHVASDPSHQRDQADGDTQEPLMDAKLFEAVARGEIQNLTNDLEQGESDLQAVTCEKDGVLHIAARFVYQDQLVDKLRHDKRSMQFDLMKRNKRGDTALHCAATTGNVNMVILLCEIAEKKNQLVEFLRATNNNEETCLHEAVRNGRTKVVRLLVEKDDKVEDELNVAVTENVSDEPDVSNAGYVTVTEIVANEPDIANSEYVTSIEIVANKPDVANSEYVTATEIVANEPDVANSQYVAATEIVADEPDVANSECVTATEIVTDEPDVANSRYVAAAEIVADEPDIPDATDKKKLLPLVEALDTENVSPLYLAATLNRVDIVKVLIEPTRKHSASYIGPRAKTALHAAAAVLNYELMKLLLEWEKDAGRSELIGKADESASTALHYLASMGTTPMVQLFLERDRETGGNAAYRLDSNGSMPIHIAAAHGRLDIVKVLLEERPDCVLSCDSSGRTILHIAVQKEKKDLVACICLAVDVPNFWDAFFLYPRLAITSVILNLRSRTFTNPFLSTAWGKINAKFRTFPNPFLSTAWGEINAKFRTILNARDKDGNTALHLAVLAGYEAGFVSLLRSPQVNLNIANREGYTPLDLAYINSESKVQLKIDRIWILDSLQVAGACPGVEPLDYLIERVGVEEDMEKNWEKIGKAAGVLAVCAVLILNASFAMPFNVANYYYQHRSTDHATASITLRVFIGCNFAAFLSSAMAIFSCTYAGFAAAEHKTRLWQLYMGTTLLGVASLAIVMAFILGLNLAFGTHIGFVSFYVLYLFMLIAVCTKISAPVWPIHKIALLSRGTLRHHSLFHRSVQNYQIILVVIFTCLMYILISCLFVVGSSTVISGPKTDGTRIAPSPGPSIWHNNLQ